MSDTLNLNKSSVNFYWKSKNSRIIKVLSAMESVEPWAVDNTESVIKHLVSFGKSLENIKTSHLSTQSSAVTVLMAYIYSSKSLRMLNWLDDNYPGLSFHYVMEARQKDDCESSKLLLDRLTTIKTLSLLGEIFTPMRTRLISGLLEDDEDEAYE